MSLDEDTRLHDEKGATYMILPDPHCKQEMAVYGVPEGFVTEEDRDRKGVDVFMMEHLLKNYFDGLSIEVFVDDEGNRHPIIKRAQTERNYEEYI